MTKTQFQPTMNETVWIKSKSTKGVVKAIHESEARTKVTFFDPKTNGKERKTIWFWNNNLSPFDVNRKSKKPANVKKQVKPSKVEEVIEATRKFNGELRESGLLQSTNLSFEFGNNSSFTLQEDGSIVIRSPKTQGYFEQVREFQKAFNCPAPDEVTEPNEQLVLNRAGYILEEVIESLHAISDNDNHFIDMVTDLKSRMELTITKQMTKERPETKLIGVVDSYLDTLYFGFGGFCELGFEPSKAFGHVHNSNMGKLFPDGKPHYNEIGKVIKPENWERDHAPELKIKKEIETQKAFGSSRFK